MKINPHHQAEISGSVVADAASFFNITPLEYHEVDDGIANTVVAITDRDNVRYFLKFYKTTHSIGSLALELKLARSLNSAGLPIPDYISPTSPMPSYNGPKGSHLLTLTKALEGTHPKGYDKKTVHQLGALHGKIHNLSLELAEGSHSFNPVNIYNFYKGNDEIKESDRRVKPVLSKLNDIWQLLPSGLVPMDLKRDNVLSDGKKITGIIDFADTAHAPLVFCLAGPLWDILETSSEDSAALLEEYVRSYQQERELTSVEHKNLAGVIAVRGWITLHGSMLTNADSALVKKQASVLQAYISNIEPS